MSENMFKVILNLLKMILTISKSFANIPYIPFGGF